MRWESMADAPCSIARALGVVGERWTLLILREIFFGSSRFDDIRRRLEISRNVLSARLDHLVNEGVLDRVSYQDRPVRYEYQLTDKGRDLYPVLLSLLRWGDRWTTGDQPPAMAVVHRGCGHAVEPTLVCPDCREPMDASTTRVRVSANLLAAGRS